MIISKLITKISSLIYTHITYRIWLHLNKCAFGNSHSCGWVLPQRHMYSLLLIFGNQLCSLQTQIHVVLFVFPSSYIIKCILSVKAMQADVLLLCEADVLIVR